MKIKINDLIYEGTGTEIMDQLRDEAFEFGEFPDTDSFTCYLRDNAFRFTGVTCTLPESDVETRARFMLMYLAKVGELLLLED